MVVAAIKIVLFLFSEIQSREPPPFNNSISISQPFLGSLRRYAVNLYEFFFGLAFRSFIRHHYFSGNSLDRPFETSILWNIWCQPPRKNWFETELIKICMHYFMNNMHPMSTGSFFQSSEINAFLNLNEITVLARNALCGNITSQHIVINDFVSNIFKTSKSGRRSRSGIGSIGSSCENPQMERNNFAYSLKACLHVGLIS